jgi:hypothetical protein
MQGVRFAPLSSILADHLLGAWIVPANDPNKATAWNDAAPRSPSIAIATTFTTRPARSVDSLVELRREPSGRVLSGTYLSPTAIRTNCRSQCRACNRPLVGGGHSPVAQPRRTWRAAGSPWGSHQDQGQIPPLLLKMACTPPATGPMTSLLLNLAALTASKQFPRRRVLSRRQTQTRSSRLPF